MVSVPAEPSMVAENPVPDTTPPRWWAERTRPARQGVVVAAFAVRHSALWA
jgi:hypothetical protein